MGNAAIAAFGVVIHAESPTTTVTLKHVAQIIRQQKGVGDFRDGLRIEKSVEQDATSTRPIQSYCGSSATYDLLHLALERRMAWDIKNNVADIADLRIDDVVTDSSFAEDTEFRLELRTSSCEIEIESDFRVFAGFSRMVLALHCHGAEVAIGERYGDYTPPNDIVTKITSDTNTSVKAGAKAGLTVNAATALTGVPVSAGISAEASRATVEKSKTAKTSMSKHVTAKPNDKWEITSLDRNVPLTAKYLTAEQPLCVIKPKAKANRSGVHAHLSAHKADLVVTAPDEKKSMFGLINTEKKNKERVFKILLGKVMTNAQGNTGQYSTINLSEITSLDTDD